MQNILKQVGIKSFLNKDELTIKIDKIKADMHILWSPRFGTRIFLLFALKIPLPLILSILIGANTSIKNFETVYTSSPSFLNIIKVLGVKFEKH